MSDRAGADSHLQNTGFQGPGGIAGSKAVNHQVGGGIRSHGEETGIDLGFEMDVFQFKTQFISGDLAISGLAVGTDIRAAAQDRDRTVIAFNVHGNLTGTAGIVPFMSPGKGHPV